MQRPAKYLKFISVKCCISTVLFMMKIFYQGNLYTMKSTYSVLTGTQVLHVADKQHGVV